MTIMPVLMATAATESWIIKLENAFCWLKIIRLLRNKDAFKINQLNIKTKE